MDTSGFYYSDGEELHYASVRVTGPNFSLNRNVPDDRDNNLNGSETHGWYWFETEEEARIFFNLPLPV